MNFAQKKQAYHKLQAPEHLDKDRELLKQRASHSPALSTGIVDKQKAQREILWALLDVATIDEIEDNRGEASVEKIAEADGIKKVAVKADLGKENILTEPEKKESIFSKAKKQVKEMLNDLPVPEKKNPKKGE